MQNIDLVIDSDSVGFYTVPYSVGFAVFACAGWSEPFRQQHRLHLYLQLAQVQSSESSTFLEKRLLKKEKGGDLLSRKGGGLSKQGMSNGGKQTLDPGLVQY